jgi:hypothetical protein
LEHTPEKVLSCQRIKGKRLEGEKAIRNHVYVLMNVVG